MVHNWECILLGPTVFDKGVGHTLSYSKEQSFQQELVPYLIPYTKLTQNRWQPKCKSSETKAPEKQSENLYVLELDNGFLDKNTKTKARKGKIKSKTGAY